MSSNSWAHDGVDPVVPSGGGEPLLYATPITSPAALACPICGGGNLHLETAVGGGDSEDVPVSFWCEGGDHPFDLRFHFHKGFVHVSVVPTQPHADQLDEQIAAAESELKRLRELRSYQGT